MMAAFDAYNINYYKRFRMEIDLQQPLPAPELPAGYFFVPWQDNLLEVHAEVKFQSFLEEVDAAVFPSLSCRQGCRYLMREISRKPGFRAEATWLVATESGYCGTVQGIRDPLGAGSIQNLGVLAIHRQRGVGQALLLQALHGFRHHGLHKAVLEVTAQNDGAIRLYRRLGFRCRKTLYKAVEAGALVDTEHWLEEPLAAPLTFDSGAWAVAPPGRRI